MTSTPPDTRSELRGLGRVLVYYTLAALIVALVIRFFPQLLGVFAAGQAFAGAADFLDQGGAPPVGAPLSPGGLLGGALVALASMGAALAIMVPVTWVYMITHRYRGYSESVVHTLLILPVAVTGIVLIVQNSVALAFSLAGIVAAVRFRTTLEDTKDAVYVFLAIGVGLASGVQAVGVAAVLSVVFNAVVLVLWRTRFGNIYADQRTRAGPLGLGDVLAGPASGRGALRVGDPAVLEAAAPKDLREVADRAVRMERYIAEERAKKKDKRANTLLLVEATSAEEAQRAVEPVLDELATRYRLAEIVPHPAGGVVLEYLARLEGEAAQGALLDRIREGGEQAVRAAEIRSLKGLKRRLV